MLLGWRALFIGLLSLLIASVPFFAGAAPTVVPKSRIVRLFDTNKVRLALPRLASDPEPVPGSTNLYWIRPQPDRPDLKYVIFVARETLKNDERLLANKQLNEAVKKNLQSLGYQIIKMVNTGNTFVVDFRGVAEVPWQPLSPGVVRGTAKFFRTGNDLSGSILLCDPPQWKDKTTQSFRNVIGGTAVSRK